MKKWKNNSEKEEKGIWILLGIMAILIIAWFIFIVPSPVPTIVEPPVLEEPTEEIVPPAKEEPPTLVESPVIEAPETPLTPVESPVVEVPPLEEPAVEDPPVKEEPTAPVKEPVVEVPPVEEPPAPPVPEIPSNFIVPDEVWENASLLVSADGTPLPGVVWFSEIPIGTRLYSPIDGYISIMEINLKEGGTLFGIILSTSPDRGYQSLNFLLRKATLLTIEPKTGEAFAVIEDASPFQTLLEKEVALEVAISPSLWESNSSITDPKTYFWSVVQAIKPVK